MKGYPSSSYTANTNEKLSFNKSSPLFSVIIPIYNTSQYLNECIDSVINQSYENLEIICLNNLAL